MIEEIFLKALFVAGCIGGVMFARSSFKRGEGLIEMYLCFIGGFLFYPSVLFVLCGLIRGLIWLFS